MKGKAVKDSEPAQSAELRRRAEERLRAGEVQRAVVTSVADARALVHELQVHQIELEMQNEELRRARMEAEEAKEKYLDLFDFAPTGHFLWDREGRILEINLAGAALLGLDRSAAMQKRFGRFVAAKFRGVFAEFLARVVAADAKQTCEVVMEREGSSVWVLVEGISAQDRKGADRLCRATVIDTSAQKRADKLAERLAVAITGTRIGMFEWELSTDELSWSSQIRQLLGLDTTTTTTTTTTTPPLSRIYHYHDWAERVHPEDLARVEAEIRRAQREYLPYEAEYRVVWPDRSVRWLADRGVFQYSAEGEAQRLLGIVMDITERKRAQEAIEWERKILQAVMDGARNAHLAYLDRDFNFVRVNEAYARSCGFRPEQMIGKNHFALYPHDENEAIFARARDTGEPAEFHDKPFVFPDQPERGVTYWDWTLNPVKNGAGKVVGLVFSLFETTARKQAEEALRESEERLRVAQQVGRVGTFDWNIVTGLNTWTPELECMYGLEPGEFGRTQPAWESLVHPEDRAEAVLRVERAFETGAPVEGEWRTVWRDGSVHWISGMWQVLKDSSGKPVRMTGVNIDITERKRAQDALRLSQERLNQAVAVASLGTFEHDHVSGAVEYSPLLRELMGFDPVEKVTLAAIIDRVVPEDREAMVEAVRRAHDPAGEGKFAVDHRVRKADGHVRWISVRAQTFFEGRESGRRPVRTVGAGLDITEQKEFQAELQRLVDERTARLQELVRELEHFSYTITHDLKSPLRAMRGFAEMMSVTCAGGG